MAEALVVIGAFSAIAPLVGQFADLGKRLNYYIRHIKHARTGIEEVDLEVSGLNFFLRIFQETVDRPESRNIPLIQAATKADFATKILRHGNIILTSADRMLCKLKPLRDDTASSWAEKVKARCRWAFENDEVQPLKISLVSIKTTMQLFYSILLVSEKESEIRARSQDGYDVSKLRTELKKLKKDLRGAQDRCKRAERNLESQQPHSSLAMPPLSELSRTVEALVKKELDRQHRERHERGSDLSSSPNTSPVASTLFSNAAAVEFPPPLNLRRNQSRPVDLESNAIPLSPTIRSADEQVGLTRINPRERGWEPTALFASEPEPHVKRSRSPQDVVVDDNINPIRVVRRIPRTQPGTGSDGE